MIRFTLKHFSYNFLYGAKVWKSHSMKSNGKPTLKIGMIIEQKVKLSKQKNKDFKQLFGCEKNENSHDISRSLINGLFSRLIGTNIPHSVYIAQNLQIKSTVKESEQIECKVQIKQYLGKNRYKLLTTVQKDGRLVVDGYAIILHQVKV